MKKSHSLLSSLALGISLTLGISTSAIAYPKNYNVRQSGVRVIVAPRSLNVTPRYHINSPADNRRYNRNYGRNYYGRDRYEESYYDNCRDRRRARRRRNRRNITIINSPLYRNNLSRPSYIKIRTVR